MALSLHHLLPALATVLALVVAASGGTLYAERVERTYVHALAADDFEQKNQGVALQVAAFREPDLLPMYGSSELLEGRYPFHASDLLGDYPTGFTIFPVGKAGATALIQLQKLSAVGDELRGRKVVISLSPGSFFRAMVEPPTYAGNFSHLDAGELAFSLQLSDAVKQGAAMRMLQYPQTLNQSPLLAFTLRLLADGSPSSRLLYAAVLPLGTLQNLVLRLQDHYETVRYIRAQPLLTPYVPRHQATLDWAQLAARAQQDAAAHASSNPLGIDDDLWVQHGAEWDAQRGKHGDAEFQGVLRGAAEWTDLDLLLAGLRDLGAEPLVVSTPIDGTIYDAWGVSARARGDYYRRLRDASARFGLAVLDFADRDGDRLFVVDPGSHLSPKGWVFVTRALDAFYHGSALDAFEGVAALGSGLPAPAAAPTVVSTAASSTPAAAATPQLVTANNFPEGTLDQVDCRAIAGWAWERTQPNSPIGVDLYDGDSLLTTLPANRPRQDLVQAGKGNGAHAFALTVPDALKDGQPHAITAQVAGRSVVLAGSPKLLTCPPG